MPPTCHDSHLIFCDLRDTIPSQKSLLSSHNLCDLRDTMPRQRSPLSFPTQPLPKEAEDFPRGGKYPKDVPMAKFLAYL